jgi:citrate synthase
MKFPTDAFTVLFAVARASGCIAQRQESMADPEQKIARPRQVYLGAADRPLVPMNKRS